MEIEGELRAELALTGVISSEVFRRLAIGRPHQEALMRGNRIARIRPGWFRTGGAKKLVVDAVGAYCVLSGAHALTYYGGWVPPNSPLRYMNLDGRPKNLSETHLHQRPKVRSSDCRYGIVPWQVALHHSFTSLPVPERVAIIDSLFNTSADRQINHAELRNVLLKMGCSLELSLADRGAESGVESLARVRLVLQGHEIRCQVRLQNGWRIDLVVDDRVAIEIDGSTHGAASQWRRDIKKSHLATAAGYQTIRFSYWDVVERWDETYALIVAGLARS